MATKPTKDDILFPTITTDANGWAVYDYGTHKQYRKKGSFLDSLTASQWKWTASTLSTFPVALAGALGTAFMDCQISPSDAAVTCFVNQQLSVALSNQYGGAVNNFTVYWSVTITTIS